MIATLTIHFHLPACSSLKEKRGRIKPLIARLHREFNVSAAEMGMQDNLKQSIVACAMVGNEAGYLQAAMQSVEKWVEANWPDGMIVEHRIDLV